MLVPKIGRMILKFDKLNVPTLSAGFIHFLLLRFFKLLIGNF